MREITYLTGDATNPSRTAGEKVLIAHVVNDVGAWGRGFVVALSKVDPRPEQCYRGWISAATLHDDVTLSRRLGKVQVAPFRENVWVANMCAQRGWRRGVGDPQALDERALAECLRGIAHLIETDHYDSVVMPRIGCGLGGAKWSTIAAIIENELCARNVDVTVYSLPGETWED